MRETHDLVNSLVKYIKASLDDNKAEDKVRKEEKEAELKLVQALSLLCVLIYLCVCIFIGGGKCSVCLEEPLLSDLQ